MNDELEHFNFGSEAEDYTNGTEIGIENLKFFKKRLEKEIHAQSKLLRFAVFELPHFEVCTSTVLNIKDDDSVKFINPKQYRKDCKKHKLPCTYINLFPHKGKLIVMLAEDRNHPSEYFKNLKNRLINNDTTSVLN
jgi:hypothetical protein